MQLSWQDEDGNLIAAAVNSSTMRHRDMFRTISELPVQAVRTDNYSFKVFCLAQNQAETKQSNISFIVQHKPELELRQVNTVGSSLQFRSKIKLKRKHTYYNIIFRCDITARPNACKVDWYLNNKPLSPELVQDGVLSLTFSPELIGKNENVSLLQCHLFTKTFQGQG